MPLTRYKPEVAAAKLRQIEDMLSRGYKKHEALKAARITDKTYLSLLVEREFYRMFLDYKAQVKELKAANKRLRDLLYRARGITPL